MTGGSHRTVLEVKLAACIAGKYLARTRQRAPPALSFVVDGTGGRASGLAKTRPSTLRDSVMIHHLSPDLFAVFMFFLETARPGGPLT
jgi:hypothetical protein